MNITKQQIIQWLQHFAVVIAENKDYLTELDAAIGDADHGINMNRGFQQVMTQLPTVETQDIGTILKTVSMTLIKSVGGASGPLYGTFFLRASAKVTGKEELTATELVSLLQEGVAGVIQRGKASLGDKTMLDVLSPSIDTLAQEIEKGNTLLDSLSKAVQIANTQKEATIPLIAKKGRASYLGERSIGHIDPGAASSYLMLQTLRETLT
jgi:phosphoenolpyruvate---glycerone phosphotransferase subunit DhaL